MNIPAFTAESSLYRTNTRYHSSVAELRDAIPAGSVVAALNYDDTANCEACENKCNDQAFDCNAVATLTWTLGLAGCAIFGPFAPACAVPVTAAYALAVGVCTAKLAACTGICYLPGNRCCPVFCELGHCCSHGETCTTHGCCPPGQAVCNGECCPEGYNCCGDICCPNNCCGGTCCDAGVPCCGDKCCGFDPGPPPPPPPNNCIFGGAPCGPKCCPPGLQCCSYSPEFGADCRTSCIH